MLAGNAFVHCTRSSRRLWLRAVLYLMMQLRCNYFSMMQLFQHFASYHQSQHEPVLLTDFGQYSNVASSSNFNSLCNRSTTFQLSKLEFIKISCTSRHAAPNFPLTRFSGNIQCIADGKCFQFRRKKEYFPRSLLLPFMKLLTAAFPLLTALVFHWDSPNSCGNCKRTTL